MNSLFSRKRFDAEAIMKFYLLACLEICLLQVILARKLFDGIPQASWDGDPRYDLTWKEFHDKVYAFKGEILDPSETLRLLEILEEKYKIRCDEESVIKYNQVLNLLEIARISNQCEIPEATFRKIDRELSYNRIYPNVAAFLDYHRRIQYHACEQRLNDKLLQDVELLPKSIGDNLQQLKESIVAANPNEQLRERAFEASNQALIVQGVANYLEKQLNPFVKRVLEGHDGINVYNMEFKKLIKEPCERIATGDKQISVYELRLVSDNKEMLEKFSPFSRNWLENFNLCRSIISGINRYTNEICDLSLSLLLKKTRPATLQKKIKKISKSCLSCIGSPE